MKKLIIMIVLPMKGVNYSIYVLLYNLRASDVNDH